MDLDPQHVLVLTHHSGRRLAARSLGAQRVMLDDLDEGKELGEANATLTPFVIDIDGAPFVVFAGPQEQPEHTFTLIAMPDHAPGPGGYGRPYPVKSGLWMSFPEPFTPGMQVTAIWQAGQWDNRRELFRLTSPPLYRDKLEPMFGPGWTQYGPREEM
jgi:hypothetical protein